MSRKQPINLRLAQFEKMIATSNVSVVGDKVHFFTPSAKPIKDRVEDDEVKEYWVQQYVLHNHERLGFERIAGPFDAGPDFRATINGKQVDVEVEVLCENYISHGHPKTASFHGVKILIVLEGEKPPPAIRRRLPEKIIHLDKKHFVRWYRKAAKKYAEEKQKGVGHQRDLVRLQFLASEFQKRWLAVCGHKDGESATCPHCNLCPYFGEPYSATPTFEAMALDFLNERKTKKFDLGSLPDPAIDDYAVKRLAGDDLPAKVEQVIRRQFQLYASKGEATPRIPLVMLPSPGQAEKIVVQFGPRLNR
jgi:hypothetical protein